MAIGERGVLEGQQHFIDNIRWRISEAPDATLVASVASTASNHGFALAQHRAHVSSRSIHAITGRTLAGSRVAAVDAAAVDPADHHRSVSPRVADADRSTRLDDRRRATDARRS